MQEKQSEDFKPNSSLLMNSAQNDKNQIKLFQQSLEGHQMFEMENEGKEESPTPPAEKQMENSRDEKIEIKDDLRRYPEEKEAERELWTVEDFIHRPCFYFSIGVFQFVGWMGLFGFILVVAGVASVGVYFAFVLVVIGIWAAFEIRSIGNLKNQINWLKRVKEALESETTRLTGQVNEAEEEVQELQSTLDSYKAEIEEHQEATGALHETNLVLMSQTEGLEKNNSIYKCNIQSLAEQEENLSSELELLKGEGDRLNTHIAQFGSVRESLLEASEEKNQKIEDILQKAQNNAQMIRGLVDLHDTCFFWKHVCNVRSREGGDGITEKSWERLKTSLKKKYRKVLEYYSSWEKIDTNDDKILEHEELEQIVRKFLDYKMEQVRTEANISTNETTSI